MLFPRVLACAMFIALMGLCLLAARRRLSTGWFLGVSFTLIAVSRVLIFWFVLFFERSRDLNASPLLQRVLLFPESLLYSGVSGVMNRAMTGTALILVGSAVWAALLAGMIAWSVRRPQVIDPPAVAP